mgnify:FL=1
MSLPSEQSWPLFSQQLAHTGQRRLVLVEGEQEWARGWVQERLGGFDVAGALWVGRDEDAGRAGVRGVSAAQYKRWLGRETGVLVWDGWQGNPPDGFAGLAGTLRAGGLLFWLMPPLAEWPGFEDPDYSRTGLDGAGEHRFLARLAEVVASDGAVVRVRQGLDERPLLPDVRCDDAAFRPGATAEQSELVARLVRFGLGRRRRPVVVTADRGRGKSAALGMAAAELLLAGRQQVLVTSPSVDNLQSFFRHAAEVMGDRVESRSESELVLPGGQAIRFLPVPELLAQKPEAEVVMVDEAAGLPASWLREVLLGWPRVAFASTVHGYEGTGRGFAIRFRQVLDREAPHWQSVELNQPVRWAQGDPLERVLFRMFLLGARGPDSSKPKPGAVSVEPWNPAQASEAELAEAFGLLVDAHYRTTPADLRQWLDDPAASSWRAVVQGKTVGVLWGCVEGGLDQDLAAQVAMGQRRLRGHLLAQSLASHGGFAEAAQQRCFRVVRIAVAEPARQLGVGRALVAAAEEFCRSQELDSLGTSFGGEAGLQSFWQGCGLRLARIGLTRERSTGEFPVQLFKGVSPAGCDLEQRLRRRFARHWQVLIPRHWADMPQELLAQLAADLPATAEPGPDDWQDLRSFAEGYRGFEVTLPLLREVCSWPGWMAWLAGQEDAGLWCRAVLQGWAWPQLQALGLVTGKGEGEMRLRQIVARWSAQVSEL